jgi:hypothetical protein
MKNLILLFILLTAFQGALFSQSCLPEGIRLETQYEIDNFQLNYPGCTEIEGDVTLIGNNFTDLNGLNVLTRIGGSLTIGTYSGGNPGLTNLTGLENLVSIGGSLSIGFDYAGNTYLISLTGLENLESIGGDLNIAYNDTLTSLMGLDSISFIGGVIRIEYNEALTSLSGLEYISTASVTGLYIHDNISLSDCEVQSICDYLASPNGTINIYNNSNGCNNPRELINACGITLSCLPFGNYYFISQADIDSFKTFYPDCRELEGDVRVDGDSITNLNGLSAIHSIAGNLSIEGNDVLTSLAGLDSVSFIGGDFYIGEFASKGNPVLADLTGLSTLTSIGGGLYIVYNDALSSLNGLNNVNSIGENLQIYDNDALTSLSGLAGLNSIGGYLDIESNAILTSLSGLDNINASSIDQLYIYGNLNLSTCDVQSICEFLANPSGSIDILYNGTGCDNPPEVAAACGFSLPCLPFGNYHFLYQTEIDNFQANYPDCAVLEGRVAIEGYTINNLNGLNPVTSIDGIFIIDDVTDLTSLSGLDNLSSIEESFVISGFNHLTDLSGLDNLSSIGGGLFISGQYYLTSLAGLDNLTSIGGQVEFMSNSHLVNLAGMENVTSIGGALRIWENQGFTSLDGLDNLTSIGGDLDIEENNFLANLSGLENLTSIGGLLRIDDNDDLTSLAGLGNINDSTIKYLYIASNYLLSSCEVQSICNILADSNAIVYIGYNADGCNSREEVELACATIFVDDLDNLNPFTIFPNPSSTQITIETKATTPKFLLSIFNLHGQELISRQMTESRTVIDISHLPQGLYFVKITRDDTVKVSKLVKE